MSTLEINETDTTKLLEALKNDVGLAIQYHSLLLHFSEHQEVFDKTCPEIWDLLNRSMIDSLISTICRICDTDGQGKREKLTITRVAGLLDSSGSLRNQVKQMICVQEQRLSNIKVIRNKSVGHANLKARLGQIVLSFDPADIGIVLKMLKEAVDLLFEFLGWGIGGWEYFEDFRIPSFVLTLEAGQREVGVIN